MQTDLLRVAIRQQAIFIAENDVVSSGKNFSKASAVLVANLRKLGYTVSEELLQALNQLTPNQHLKIFNLMKELLGVDLNWAPLVKGWDEPTNESVIDHIITLFVNAFSINNGARLQCGHIIPDNTFPLERYNGCPFCGTPFQFAAIENYGQGSKLKVLELWKEEDLTNYFKDLLESRTALDATQADSLKTLLKQVALPAATVSMKETQMLVIDTLVENGESDRAQVYFSTPNDILRYLWYKQTGFLQIIEPRTIVRRTGKNNQHIRPALGNAQQAITDKHRELKLKYNRQQCRMVATWLNNLNMDVEKACETMHPKRGMWVRFIRALRLAESAGKPEFTYLKELMDVFYNQAYTVYQGMVNTYRLKADANNTFALLKQRPGLFARSLFANMLWFGANETLQAFEEVIPQVPTRLIITLNMYASNYFDPKQKRAVKPLGGVNKMIAPNQLLNIYSEEELAEMVEKVEELCIKAIRYRFSQMETTSKTMYIDPALYDIPLAIGDRSETIQDISCALMGTRFPIEGSAVRLFMQWGKGLPAQHLDMDLSCRIISSGKVEYCSFNRLVSTGAKHSGDIQSIPNKVGTAEYIELDINALTQAEVQYVVFTCNAYSNGAISPNLVVGWMNSAYPMKISNKSGVAYDPSCVQHQVRVSQGLTKGLVFGVLDVESREIIWLEMAFSGQIVQSMSVEGVAALLKKLKSKMSIGNLLKVKAEAQGIELVDTDEADEVYSMQWAMNTAAVTQLMVG